MLIFLTPHLGINWSLRSCSASLYLNIFFGKQALHHKHFLKMAMYKYIIRYDNSKGAHWKFYVLTIHISGARSARAVKLYTYQKWCNNNNNPSRRGNRSVILEKWLLDIVVIEWNFCILIDGWYAKVNNTSSNSFQRRISPRHVWLTQARVKLHTANRRGLWELDRS